MVSRISQNQKCSHSPNNACSEKADVIQVFSSVARQSTFHFAYNKHLRPYVNPTESSLKVCTEVFVEASSEYRSLDPTFSKHIWKPNSQDMQLLSSLLSARITNHLSNGLTVWNSIKKSVYEWNLQNKIK